MHTIFRAALALGCFSLLSTTALSAQERADSLFRAVAALSARLDSLERGTCPTGPAVAGPAGSDSASVAVAALSRRLERLIAARCPRGGAAAPADGAVDELEALRQAAAEVAAAAAPGAAPADTAPADPVFIGRQRSASALNPDISATGDIRLVARDESPQRDNGVAREFEIAIQSTLDPYSSAKIFLAFEDEEIGIEEGYVTWTGLPGRVRLDVGKFRQSAGDLNRWHLHALPESEYPLVYQQYLSPEGLGGVGVSLYTPLPLSLAGGTHELTLQGTTAESDPLYAGGRQPTVLGRLQNFWQLSRSTYTQLGVTGVGGNNADSALASRLLGVDFRITWRPPQAGTRRELTFRAEGYRFHADEAGATTTRYGGFAGLTYRASRRWVLGLRGDWLESPRGARATEWQLSPTLTFWQSEFVYLRLEGQRHHHSLDGTRNQLLLQAVFAMGPHKHETY
jgi:hypothetical protein